LEDDQIYQMKPFYENQLKKYGKIYRNEHGIIYTANPDDFSKIFQDEANAVGVQEATPLWSLQAIANKYNYPPSLISMSSDEFSRRKDSLKKGMIAPKGIRKLTRAFNDVTVDLIALIEKNKKDNIVHDLKNYLYRWTTETTGMIVFHERIGALEDTVDENIDAILNSGMLDSFFMLEMRSTRHRKMNTDAWNEFENNTLRNNNASRNLYAKHGQCVMDKKVPLTDAEKVSTIESLFAAANAPTAETALWFILILSKLPHVQELLYQEIKSVVGDKTDIDEGTLQKMPYVRATLKELFRYRPVSLQTARVTNTDLILSDYHVPAKSVVFLLLGLIDQTQYLRDAEVFRPERWLKNDPKYEKIHPMLSLPFGHGARSCMGRRLADNNLNLILIHMFRNYKITHRTPEVETGFNFFYNIRNKQDFRLENRC